MMNRQKKEFEGVKIENMEQEIRVLKARFRTATGKELEVIDKEMENLAKSNPSEFEDKMLSTLRETNHYLEKFVSRKKLECV